MRIWLASLLIGAATGGAYWWGYHDAAAHDHPVRCQGAISAAGPAVIRGVKIVVVPHEAVVIYFPKGCKP